MTPELALDGSRATIRLRRPDKRNRIEPDDLVAPAGHGGTVWSARFSADGKHVITGSDDGTARLWDAEGKPLVAVLPFRDLAEDQARVSLPAALT